MAVISKEMSKALDVETRKLAEPALDAMMAEISDYLDMLNQKENAIKQNKEAVLKESREFLAKWITGEDERHLIEEGFNIIREEAEHSLEGRALLEDFRNVGERTKERISQTDVSEGVGGTEEEIKIFDTLQVSLGVSSQSVDTIYKMGYDFFHNREIEKALAVFSLLTVLNNFIFEPWLMLGVTYKEVDNLFQAMYAFSMASLVNLHHPLPHLYSAEIYYLNGNKDLAQQTLDYGLSLISEEDLKAYQSRIEEIKDMLK